MPNIKPKPELPQTATGDVEIAEIGATSCAIS
jgi:hypothetical protein